MLLLFDTIGKEIIISIGDEDLIEEFQEADYWKNNLVRKTRLCELSKEFEKRQNRKGHKVERKIYGKFDNRNSA